MNKFQKTVTSAFAAGLFLVSGALPLFASTTLVITGNGTNSTNTETVNVTQSTSVTQSNNANVDNDVHANAETGKNDVSDNTGGDVSVDTGNADVDVKVTNTLNSNAAKVDCCGSQNTDVLISGNGSDSTNTVDLDMKAPKNSANFYIDQSNKAKVDNDVYADAKTGDNKAKDNTGGNVSIDTGDAHVGVVLATAANANSAKIGGTGKTPGTLSAKILGNGHDSDNLIDLDLENSTWIVQENKADVDNYVDADAKTGKNEAKDNTGGSVEVDTGDADVDVSIDNAVNFNWADAECGCLIGDLLAKIADNGSDTTNTITAALDNTLGVTQENCGKGEWGWRHHDKCKVDNDVYADAKTGDNKLKDNTGDPGDDPSVDTGNAMTNVELTNSGNSNVYGGTPDWNWPDLGNVDLHLSFDLSDLLDWLMSH